MSKDYMSGNPTTILAPAVGMKIEITFISHRGMAGHENLFPETYWMEVQTLDLLEIGRELSAHGFLIQKGQHYLRDRYITPAAIIQVAEYRKDE